MKKILTFFEKAFLSLFFVGYIPFLSGTFGSLLAFIIACIFIYYFYFGFISFFIISVLVSFLSVFVIDIYEKREKKHDASFIVIDEFVGIFLTLGIIIIFSENIYFLWLGFFAFRFFDMLKPWIIGYIDRGIKGGLGVVLDDVVAGVFAGIFSLIILFLYGFLF